MALGLSLAGSGVSAAALSAVLPEVTGPAGSQEHGHACGILPFGSLFKIFMNLKQISAGRLKLKGEVAEKPRQLQENQVSKFDSLKVGRHSGGLN